jgi:hypothetical protein
MLSRWRFRAVGSWGMGWGGGGDHGSPCCAGLHRESRCIQPAGTSDSVLVVDAQHMTRGEVGLPVPLQCKSHTCLHHVSAAVPVFIRRTWRQHGHHVGSVLSAASLRRHVAGLAACGRYPVHGRLPVACRSRCIAVCDVASADSAIGPCPLFRLPLHYWPSAPSLSARPAR